MKYIKSFEQTNTRDDLTLNVGDHVKIIKKGIPDVDIYKSIVDFLNDNVGIICSIELNNYDPNIYYFYNVKYDNVPDDLFKFTRYMGSDSQMRDGLKEQGEIFTADENEIRLATPKEIELQKLKKVSNKYNL